VGDNYYTMATVNQFLRNVSCCVMIRAHHTSDAERSVYALITYGRQLVNMTFNTAWLWIKEIRYHSTYVSAAIYSEMGVALATYAIL
jgi:hypothetical protein